MCVCQVRLIGSRQRAADGSIKEPLNGFTRGKFVADVKERISTQVEWPCSVKATGVQSRGGRRMADGSQRTHTNAQTHTNQPIAKCERLQAGNKVFL